MSRKHHMTRAEYLSRVYEFVSRGSQLPQAKLDEDKVRAIRANREGWTVRQQAEHFGVSESAIQKVRSYHNWGWVR